MRLPYPDSRFAPGAIVLAERCHARWLGHVRDCGVPEQLLEINMGHIGDLQFDAKRRYGVDAVLTLAGVEAGPQIDRASHVEIVQEQLRVDSLNLLNWDRWLQETGGDGLTCQRILNQPNVYVIGDSLRVDGGRYSFYDSSNRQLAISGGGNILALRAGADLVNEEQGTLVLTQPVYTHFRRVSIVDGALIVLGSDTDPSDDDRFLATIEGRPLP